MQAPPSDPPGPPEAVRPLPVLGVLGGMGPLATAEFYRQLVLATPAEQDQDHIPCLIRGDPRIPDRSRAILAGKADTILPLLLAGLADLSKWGAAAACIPCNTAHYWLDQLAAVSPIPIIDMVGHAARDAVASGAKTIAVLGTPATTQLGLYSKALGALGSAPLELGEEDLRRSAESVYAVKEGRMLDAVSSFAPLIASLAERADAIILGCTELPLLVPSIDRCDAFLVDPMRSLAKACVEWAMVESERRSPCQTHIGS